jgi:DNA-binding response OmpR family regulator
MTGRILVVEDELALRDVVTYALRGEGFEVVDVADAEEGIERARTDQFDLLLMDVMLPGVSGLEACRRLRGESDLPIIFLTGKGSEADRVLGLEAGADDYVVKPFSMPELLSRVRALLRRRALDLRPAAPVRRAGDIEIDFARRRATVGGQEKYLTPAEFSLLTLMVEEPGRVFSRRDLIRHLWHTDFVGAERACDKHISNLRRKIEPDPGNPERIVTVRGVGYVLRAL